MKNQTDSSLSGQTIPSAILNLLTLQEEFYSELRQSGKSLNTQKNYKTDLECFNDYLLKTQKLLSIDKLGAPEMMAYGDYLSEKYSSDNSRRRRIQALRSFFDFILAKGIIPHNPVRKIPTSPKFLDIPRPTPFIDIKTLWEHLLMESHSTRGLQSLKAKRQLLCVSLVFFGALKVSDLGNLKKDQLLLGRTNEAEGESRNAGRILMTPAKKPSYSIPLPHFLNHLGADYLLHFNEVMNTDQLTEKSAGELLFNANAHKILSGGLTPRGLEIIFEDYRKKLVITLTPKSLRQAGIINWINQKHPDASIKEWMGVAPSYDLKLYKQAAENFKYQENYFSETYFHQKKRPS